MVRGTQEARAWELHHLLSSAAQEWPPRVERVDALLREYAALELVERPSLLHSLVLTEACRVAPRWSAFAGFVRWWQPEGCLREEDLVPNRSSPPLAVHLGRALGRWFLAQGAFDSHVDWALDWLQHLAERYPDDQHLREIASRADEAAMLMGPLEPP